MKKGLRLLAFGALLALSAHTASAQTIVGLTNNDRIVLISNANNPSNMYGPYTISGITAGQSVIAIDYNPANGMLYALGYNQGTSQAQLYTLNSSGNNYTATAVGNAMSIPMGNPNSVGFDFDAGTANALYITTGSNNYMYNIATGTLTVAGNMMYDGNDVNAGSNINLGTTAYLNNFYGSDNTRMYAFDNTTNSLVKFNGGTATTVGLTGLTLYPNWGISMDSYYDKGNHSNTVYFAGRPMTGPGYHLYQMDLATGNATDIGLIGSGNEKLQDIAVKTDFNIPSAIDGNMMVGLTLNKRNLVFFDSEHPDIIRSVVTINGMTTGQTMMAIDFRPMDMNLYGLGYNPANGQYQLYRIDMVTGTATALNATPVNITLGSSNTVITGFDFDPTQDYIRVTGSNGMNARISPISGQIISMDNNYGYASGDANYGNAANLGAIAYTNSYNGSASTQLVGLDYTNGSMIQFGPSMDGTMNTMMQMNMLGTGANTNGYMDVYYDSANANNMGYLAANTNFASDMYAEFYTMNPMDGNTQYIGTIGPGIAVRDIAAQPMYKGLAIEAVATFAGNGKMYLFPNPAVNYAHIILPNISRNPVHVYVTDMQGGNVNHYIYAPGGNEVGIDLTSFRNGTYSIRVHEAGRPVQIARLLKY